MRVEPGADKKILKFGCFAHDETVVRREAFRPVHEMPDAGVLEHRNHLHRPGHRQFELVPILLQFPELELFGQRAQGQWLGIRLERADQQFSGVFLDIHIAISVTKDWQVGWYLGIGFGCRIHMFG